MAENRYDVGKDKTDQEIVGHEGNSGVHETRGGYSGKYKDEYPFFGEAELHSRRRERGVPERYPRSEYQIDSHKYGPYHEVVGIYPEELECGYDWSTDTHVERQ